MSNDEKPAAVTSEHPAQAATPPPQKGAALSTETQEMLRFVREENKANRDYFTTLSRLTFGAIVFVIALVGATLTFFGWRTVDQIENQARAATETEIVRMRNQIQDRINHEFETPVIKATVAEAARVQTKQAAGPIIQQEVAKQVASVISGIAPLKQIADTAAIALSAQGDDALAFDQLVSMHTLPENDTRRKMADSIVRAVKDERNSHPWQPNPWMPERPPMEQILKAFDSHVFRDPQSRKAHATHCP